MKGLSVLNSKKSLRENLIAPKVARVMANKKDVCRHYNDNPLPWIGGALKPFKMIETNLSGLSVAANSTFTKS